MDDDSRPPWWKSWQPWIAVLVTASAGVAGAVARMADPSALPGWFRDIAYVAYVVLALAMIGAPLALLAIGGHALVGRFHRRWQRAYTRTLPPAFMCVVSAEFDYGKNEIRVQILLRNPAPLPRILTSSERDKVTGELGSVALRLDVHGARPVYLIEHKRLTRLEVPGAAADASFTFVNDRDLPDLGPDLQGRPPLSHPSFELCVADLPRIRCDGTMEIRWPPA